MVHLSSRLIVGFAPEDAQGLEKARPSELSEIEVSPSGFGLHCCEDEGRGRRFHLLLERDEDVALPCHTADHRNQRLVAAPCIGHDGVELKQLGLNDSAEAHGGFYASYGDDRQCRAGCGTGDGLSGCNGRSGRAESNAVKNERFACLDDLDGTGGKGGRAGPITSYPAPLLPGLPGVMTIAAGYFAFSKLKEGAYWLRLRAKRLCRRVSLRRH